MKKLIILLAALLHRSTATPANESNQAIPWLARLPRTMAVRLVSRLKKGSRKARVLFVCLLILLITPLAAAIAGLVDASLIYVDAHSGVQHLLNVKSLLTDAKTHPTGALDSETLQRAQQELALAHDDFAQLQDMLDHAAFTDLAAFLFPAQMTSARSLSRIGLDITDIGQRLLQTAQAIAPTLRGPRLSDTTKPLITPAMLPLIGSTLDDLLPRLNDMQLQSRFVSPDSLPLSASQRQQITQLLQILPLAQADLTEGRALLNAFGWLLGVDQPRTFLVQTMDRAELRPTGGFTGQFGELRVNGARITPFSLKNIGPYEENNPTSVTNGQSAPEPYRAWWPIPNWGLRDSNLSADFPTSARFAMQAYKFEFGRQVDGVIVLSPFLIERVLQITGPIAIPAYHETITAQNLEERLHYYQLDNAGIRKEEIIEHVPDTSDAPQQARKLFTARLARLLMDHVRRASPDKLLILAHEFLYALKTKDVQVYAANPQVEGLLARYGDASLLDRSTTHDDLFIVQANLSASKASQYVRTIMQDTVTLDARGGATHLLKLRLIYNQLGPVYGLDTYRDYVRVYTPPTSHFLWGNGFDSGQPLCGASLPACPRYDAYGDGSLLCPPGMTQAGYATSLLNDPYAMSAHPIDKIGPPTNMSSDEAGRTMFAGWLVVPKNCTLTATLSWYVPPQSQRPYTLLIQRQSSTLPTLDLTILPTPANCTTLQTPGLHFTGPLNGPDLLFTLPPKAANCYPQPDT